MSVVGQQLYNELKDASCLQMDETPPAKKSYLAWRSFLNMLSEKEDIKLPQIM